MRCRYYHLLCTRHFNSANVFRPAAALFRAPRTRLCIGLGGSPQTFLAELRGLFWACLLSVNRPKVLVDEEEQCERGGFFF